MSVATTPASRKSRTTRPAVGNTRAVPPVRTVGVTRAHARAKAAVARPVVPMPDLLLNATEGADIVTIPERRVLAIDGAGGPEQEAFQLAMGALYGVAYTLKFSRKKLSAAQDFKIGPVEGRWSADLEGAEYMRAPRERWRWQLRIAVPADVTADDVAVAVHGATTRKNGKLFGSAEAAQVRLEVVPAQQVGRALHVGPYSEEDRTFTEIQAVIAEAGLRPAFTHLEVYLNDPRRTAPDELATVLLRELA